MPAWEEALLGVSGRSKSIVKHRIFTSAVALAGLPIV